MVDFSLLKKTVNKTVNDCIKESQKRVIPYIEKGKEKITTQFNDKLCDIVYSLDKDSLNEGWTDKIAFYSKHLIQLGIGTYLPMLGSFFTPIIAEIMAGKIPNQRIDRVVRYAQTLEARLTQIESGRINHLLSDDNFRNLVKESCLQAMQTVTDKRFDYLTSVVMNGISKDPRDFSLPQNILKALKHVNDLEIQLLKTYQSVKIEELGGFSANDPKLNNHNFRNQSDLLNQNNEFKDHLVKLKLLKKDLNHVRDNTYINNDSFENFKDEYDISNFGEQFLNYIGN